MAHFPNIVPFYDPANEQEVYDDKDGRLHARVLSSQTRSDRGVFAPHGYATRDSRIKYSYPQECGLSKVEASWAPHVNEQHGEVFYVGLKTASRGEPGLPSPAPARQNGCLDPHPHSPVPAHSQPASPHSQRGGKASPRGRPDADRNGGVPDRFDSDSESSHSRGSWKDRGVREKGDMSQNVFSHAHTNGLDHHLSHLAEDVGGERSRDVRAAGEGWKEGGDAGVVRGRPPVSGGRTTGLSVVEGSNLERRSRTRGSWREQRKCKSVILQPDFRSVWGDEAEGVVLCEKLFGITLCKYKHKNSASSSASAVRDRKLVVQGVVPGSPAEATGLIHRGDMLISVNDIEVSWLNIDGLLRTIRKREGVKLTLQVPVIVGPRSGAGQPARPASHDLYRLVTGQSLHQGEQPLASIPCGVLFLTLSGSEDLKSSMEDVVYMYPSEDNQVLDIRGLFLTLSSSLIDATGSSAKNSTLQMRDGQHLNIAYCKADKDVLVLVLPSKRVPLTCLNQLMAETQHLLCLMFGSIHRAFTACDRGQLDQLFALLLLRAVGQKGAMLPMLEDTPSALRLLDTLAAPRRLQLSEENQLICDEILSEYEALDFDEFLEDGELWGRRLFVVLGSALWYKNYLLTSHLPSADLAEVHTLLRQHCLLLLSSRQPLEELVVWQEVHPLGRRHPPPTPPPPGYSEPRARWFLLLVGMKHFMLSVLLEAGGCAEFPRGRRGPHPLYVDQAKATLLQLQTDEVAMAECCEERLLFDTGSICLASAEKFLLRSKLSREDLQAPTLVKSASTPRLPGSPGRGVMDSNQKWRSSPQTERRTEGEVEGEAAGAASASDTSTPVMRRQGSKLSYGSNDSAGSGSSSGAPRSKSSRFSSLFDLANIGRSLPPHQPEALANYPAVRQSGAKLTRGKENVLFNYVELDGGEGVLVSPSDNEIASLQGAVHSQVLDNFYRCALHIHALFQDSSQHRVGEAPRSRFRPCDDLLDVQEHGVLFQLRPPYTASDSRRPPPSALAYWVVGRSFPFPNQKELYVCFHESVSQNLVELAFSLGTGA